MQIHSPKDTPCQTPTKIQIQYKCDLEYRDKYKCGKNTGTNSPTKTKHPPRYNCKYKFDLEYKCGAISIQIHSSEEVLPTRPRCNCFEFKYDTLTSRKTYETHQGKLAAIALESKTN